MSDHDGAAVVGQMAGLDTERLEPVTPDQLVDRFCADVPAGLVADPGAWQRDEENGCEKAKGFCGYIGGRGDSITTGFDDGYGFMGYLNERGWAMAHEKGDWPYLVYLLWRPAGERPVIAEYCEADLTLWRFDDIAPAAVFYRTLRDCP